MHFFSFFFLLCFHLSLNASVSPSNLSPPPPIAFTWNQLEIIESQLCLCRWRRSLPLLFLHRISNNDENIIEKKKAAYKNVFLVVCLLLIRDATKRRQWVFAWLSRECLTISDICLVCLVSMFPFRFYGEAHLPPPPQKRGSLILLSQGLFNYTAADTHVSIKFL